MGKINKLNELVSNIIAAGEVVESPFNVVKELVENSLDAKSKKIVIALKESGLNEISITDDGEGMDEEDAISCFQRHATSKIKNEQDLFRITSLGFRGEALPTIGSVSRVELTTTQNNIGTKVNYNAGEIISKDNIAPYKGTKIIVKNLFYNTPARLKYVKSLSVELSKITNIIEKMALSFPKIAFKLSNNNKVIIQTSGTGNIKEVINDIYGLKVMKNIIETENRGNAYNFKIYFTKPEILRSRKKDVTLIINNRVVNNYKIVNAIVNAYKTFIPEKKYPIAILYLEIDPILLDVNVHPSKLEIKLANENEVCNLLSNSIREKLGNNNLIPNIEIEKVLEKEKVEFQTFDFKNDYIENASSNNIQENKFEKIEIKEKEDNSYLEKNIKFPFLNYLGQYNRTYILAQDDKNLYLIDQHAAQERINYEIILEKLVNPDLEKYNLLIPINIILTKDQIILINSNLGKLIKLGIELELNENKIQIKSVPNWIKKGNEESTIMELINILNYHNDIDFKLFMKDIAAMKACKASIKANHDLTKDEIYMLLGTLRECENPFTCPHGRPTLIKFSDDTIQKLFKRKN